MGQSASNDDVPGGGGDSLGGVPASKDPLSSVGWKLADSTPTETLLSLGASENPPPADSTGMAGLRLGELIIERRLGAGGMGEVWRGHDAELDLPVAIKILPPRLAEDANFVIRFQREARAVARLDHPNIVRVLQAGRREHNGRFLRLMVMELVEGVDLSKVLLSAGGRLDAKRAAEITLEAAYALRYAHAKGVVHRDIKPANLLVPNKKEGPAVKVLDFGLALLNATRAPEADDKSTRTGAVMGTPLYMSPEQAEGKHVDARTDIYSLGITLYEMLAGRTPYEADSIFSIIKGHIEGTLEFPKERFGEAPQLLVQLIQGMCAKTADDRLPLKHVIEQLEQFLDVTHASTPATPSNMGPRTNIQPPPTSFVGREREMAALNSELRQGARLVTILGPGGIGKTRFVSEFGLWVANDYPAGVWFCDLTEARTEAGVSHGVGQGMGIPLTQEDPIAQIHAALRLRGRMLIILDNFEQVTQHAAKTLGLWLKDTPEVQFIATSREPLHLTGERSFPLDTLSASEADDAPAIRLFADRAAEVRRGFTLDASNLDAVSKIVQQLDGIPLAIELAAARVAAMPPQKILERLSNRLQFLAGKRRDTKERHMTLEGTIDWSWELLEPWEKLALAQCSVFRDGFFLEAAESVLDLSAFAEAPMVIDVIENLVEKSLLKAYEVPQIPGEARFRLLETVRVYAEEKMADPRGVSGCTGEEPANALRRRHGKYFADYGSRLYFREVWNSLHLDRLELDLANFLQLQDVHREANPQFAALSALAVAELLESRGPWSESIPRLERVARALPQEPTHLRAELLRALSWAYFRDGDTAKMVATSRSAVETADALPANDPDRNLRLAYCLVIHGRALSSGGSQEEALSCYDRAVALLPELAGRDDSIGAYRGVALRKLGRMSEALDCFVQAERQARNKGALGAAAVCCMHRAGVLESLRDLDGAQTCYLEAKALMLSFGNLRGTGNALDGLAKIHEARGELESAIKCYEEAEECYRQVGMRKVEAYCMAAVGKLLGFSHKFEQALQRFGQAAALWTREQDWKARAYAEMSCAWCLLGLHRFEDARATALAAEAMGRDAGAVRPRVNARVIAAKAVFRILSARGSDGAVKEQQMDSELKDLRLLYQVDRQALEAADVLQLVYTLGLLSTLQSRPASSTAELPRADVAVTSNGTVESAPEDLAIELLALAAKHNLTATHVDPDVREALDWAADLLGPAPTGQAS